MSAFPEFHLYDGLGLAELVRHRAVSPIELVDEAIGRIEARHAHLNLISTPMFEQARQAARQPLPQGAFSGVPFLLKDLAANWQGVPTASGNRLLANLPAQRDSELVRRYKAAGLIVLAKTNTPELGLTPYRAKTIRPQPQSVEPQAHPRRFQRRFGGGSRRAHRTHGPRRRWRWIDPHPRLLLRTVRLQANTRAHTHRPGPWRIMGRLRCRARHHPFRARQRRATRRYRWHRHRRPVLRSNTTTPVFGRSDHSAGQAAHRLLRYTPARQYGASRLSEGVGTNGEFIARTRARSPRSVAAH